MALVAFDFDGTLTETEMTVALGEQAGVADDMIRITEKAMNDEIDYAESLRQRVRLVADLPGEAVASAFDTIELREGCSDLLAELSRADTRTAILTGGFERGVRRVLERADAKVDVIIANRLEVSDRTLTGGVDGPLVEGTKDVALRALIEEYDESLGTTAAVGDGANDLPMLQAAGLGIGFQPKPAVAPACDITVSSVPELKDVLLDNGFFS